MNDIFRQLRHNFDEVYYPLLDSGLNDREIAEKLGIHPGTLMKYKKRQNRIDKLEQEKRIEELMKYMNDPAISKNLKGLDKWKR